MRSSDTPQTRQRAIRYLEWVAPVFLIGFSASLALGWVLWNQDTTFSSDDRSVFVLAQWYCREFHEGLLPHFADQPYIGAPYPPLVPLLAGLLFRMTGSQSPVMAIASQWPWHLLLVTAAWSGLHRERGLLLALTAVALAPVLCFDVDVYSFFYTEPAVAALALASVVCLVRSEGFTRPVPCIALGLCLALGLLSKWSFGFFLGPPMILAVGIAVTRAFRGAWGLAPALALVAGCLSLVCWFAQEGPAWARTGSTTALLIGAGLFLSAILSSVPRLRRSGTWRMWLGLGACVLVLTVLAAPWYLENAELLRSFLGHNLNAGTFGGARLTWKEAAGIYPSALLLRQMGLPSALLLGVGLLRMLFPGRSRLACWCLLAFACGYLALWLAPYRNPRYLAAGYGLLVPVAVEALALAWGLRYVVAPPVLLMAMFHQQTWLALPWNDALHRAFDGRVMEDLAPPIRWIATTHTMELREIELPGRLERYLWMEPVWPRPDSREPLARCLARTMPDLEPSLDNDLVVMGPMEFLYLPFPWEGERRALGRSDPTRYIDAASAPQDEVPWPQANAALWVRRPESAPDLPKGALERGMTRVLAQGACLQAWQPASWMLLVPETTATAPPTAPFPY